MPDSKNSGNLIFGKFLIQNKAYLISEVWSNVPWIPSTDSDCYETVSRPRRPAE